MKNKLIILMMLLTLLFTLNGCGFVMEEEKIEIASITHKLLDDGQTMVVITYKNEDIEPSIFYLPKGEDGTSGVGIDTIFPNTDKPGVTTLEITLTNGVVKSIDVPNGISITNTLRVDRDGKSYMCIQFSDGTEKEIELDRGPAGKDGLNIVDIKQEEITDKDSEYYEFIKVTFTFSDGTEENTYNKEIYIRPGKAGNGIASTTHKTQDGYYIINIFYTDGRKPDEIKFPIPQVSEWLSGEGTPNTTLGKDGDFYLDTKNGTIYKKVSKIWTDVCQLPMPDSADFYLITLDLNANSDPNAGLGEGISQYISVKPNSSIFANNSTLPIPYRIGYRFLGWYATPNPTINSGVFNDLTVVNKSLTLYAKWEKIAE